jgi:hypothetical protein
MKDNRRNFIRKAALGSAALSTATGISILDAKTTRLPADEKANKTPGVFCWEIHYDDSDSTFLFKNGSATIQGTMEFISGNRKWKIVKSRDGVSERYAIVDPEGNVQGYLITRQDGGLLKLLCYHRTAQGYRGFLSFEGVMTFPSDSFACRTRPDPDERVLSLFSGPADSLLNDSIFNPETDTLLRINAAELQIKISIPVHIASGYRAELKNLLKRYSHSILKMITSETVMFLTIMRLTENGHQKLLRGGCHGIPISTRQPLTTTYTKPGQERNISSHSDARYGT